MWLSALIGGAVIGLSVAILAIFTGKIAGISGIVGSTIEKFRFDWQLFFILGLLLAPWVYRIAAVPPEGASNASGIALIFGGILVGFGTRLGNGCTSGHGICGLARKSPRSLIATVLFIGTAAITVFILHHLLG